MLTPTFRRAAAASLLLAAPLALSAWAGPLDPPPGPIAPTSKPLAEVEPRTAVSAATTPGDADSLFKLTQPGSYYLTGNIASVNGRSGIEIAASNVSIDLRGFTLLGVGTPAGIIATVASLKNIEIHDGAVTGWGGAGVDLGNLTSTGCTVRNIRATENSSSGFSIGIDSSVIDCVARNNGFCGIITGRGVSVVNCNTAGNSVDGINVGDRTVVSGCHTFGNAGDGIQCGSGSVVSGCAAAFNGTRD